jgi:hypothetical protein
VSSPSAYQLTSNSILDRIEKFVKDLGQDGHQGIIKSNIDKEFALLCGEFPGAVTVRQLYTEIQATSGLDEGYLPGTIEDINETSRSSMGRARYPLANRGFLAGNRPATTTQVPGGK